jgi:hypothetical protein
MRCLGITKQKKRCRNHATFLYCARHVWQPASGVVLLGSLVAFYAGLFQDLIKPIYEARALSDRLRRPVSVEIKKDRRQAGVWENDDDPTKGKSDVVTIFLDRQPVKSFEFYQNAKDQRFKDYPGTFPLADFYIPTEAAAFVIDLDDDGASEIVIKLSNQLYSLHHDQQVNLLVYNAVGELLARTPYPREIPGLAPQVLAPYSAYKTTAAVREELSGVIQSATFANDVNIFVRDGQQRIQISWVIDNASYVGPHLHQVEEFAFIDGKLEPLAAPRLFVSEGWTAAAAGKPLGSTREALAFLQQHNLPPFSAMLKEAGRATPSVQAAPPDTSAAPIPLMPLHENYDHERRRAR